MGMHVFTVFYFALVQRQAEIDNISKWKGNQEIRIWTHDLCDTGAALYQLS